MKQLKLLILTLIVALSSQVKAQDYDYAAGFRAGPNWSIAFKNFQQPELAMEGMLSFRNKGIQITGLVEHYFPIKTKFKGWLFWYAGYGIHTGYYRKDDGKYESNSLTFRPIIGTDAMLGITYKLERSPFSFGFDFKPYLDFFTANTVSVRFDDTALTLRYHFD